MCNQPVLFMHVKQGQIMCPKINSKSSEQIGLTNTKWKLQEFIPFNRNFFY